MGRPFDIARSNYVVTDYHTELVQMITALELADLSISDYSCTFDDSYSLLKSDVNEFFLVLGLSKVGPLHTDLMLAYPLKGMAIFSSF